MKYQWLKLNLKFYQTPEVEWLLKQDDGCNYVVLYQMLCMLGAADGSGIIIKHIADFTEPYSASDLSDLTHMSASVVKAGLLHLVKLNMITIREDKSIVIPDIKKMVGNENKLKKKTIGHRIEDQAQREKKNMQAKIRMRKYRARKKLMEGAKKELLPEAQKLIE